MTLIDNEKPTILIIDDDSEIRYSLDRVLSRAGYQIIEAASGEEGIEIVKKKSPSIIFLDIRMGGMTGIEALQHLRSVDQQVPIILMTAFGTTQTAIEAMKFGAFDYVMKPFDQEKVLGLAESALKAVKDFEQADSYEPKLKSEDYKEGIVGNSPAMQEVFKIIGQVAASDATVLISGESGTGKELIARALVQHSLRSKAPFIPVNCAAIPDNLIESELFGHEKGSFTGATAQRKGKFEQCDQGTIFLDEIGDMALTTQTKILRVLQEGEIQRVGGSEMIKVDIRIIAATNKDMEAMIREKTFREDLYYRLNVVRIRVPSLRERTEDIPELVDFMLQILEKQKKAKVRKVSPEAMNVLCRYSWSGNVRELENAIYRSAVMAKGEAILIKHLPEEITNAVHIEKEDTKESSEVSNEEAEIAAISTALDSVFSTLKTEADGSLLKRLEDEMIIRAFNETGEDAAAAAKLLGLTQTDLKKRLKEIQLQE
ncbi:MAG: sigma-54-dependent Fis family transcriptional regulator [Opitutaceae bacterium]|nr:sigma-54-dependent Fis family transcriptional regulator [Opitutaceae bacterium]